MPKKAVLTPEPKSKYEYTQYPAPRPVRCNLFGQTIEALAIAINDAGRVKVRIGDRETIIPQEQIEWLPESSTSGEKLPDGGEITTPEVSLHPQEPSGASSQELKIGDRVWYGEQANTGAIEWIEGQFAEIAFDNGKSAEAINLSRLHPVSEPEQVSPPPRKSRKGARKSDHASNAKSSAVNRSTDEQTGDLPAGQSSESSNPALDNCRISPIGETGISAAAPANTEVHQDNGGTSSTGTAGSELCLASAEISTTTPIVSEATQLSLMNAEEARSTIASIKTSFENIRLLLLDLHDRQGWKALGYESWRECVTAEFSGSQSYFYNQLAAAKIEQELDSTIGEIKESQLRPLSKLPEGTRRDAWEEANAIAAENGQKVTGAIVAEVVEKRLQPREIQATFDLVDDLATPTWEQIKALYAQIGQIRPVDPGIAVEGRGFSVVLPSREVAWKAWQNKYKGYLPEESAVVQVPKSAPEPPEKRDRVANDYYPTPAGIVRVLLDRVQIKGQVFEPCAGHGAIADFFPNGITNEPYPASGFVPDFEEDATDPGLYEAIYAEGGFDWAITNPPYGMELPIQILKHCFAHARVGCAFLLRLGFLEPCSDRAEWLATNADHLRLLIPVNPRPQFRKDTDKTDNITVAWFVFDKTWSWSKQGIQCPFGFVTDWK